MKNISNNKLMVIFILVLIIVSTFSLIVNAKIPYLTYIGNEDQFWSYSLDKESVDIFTLSFNGEQKQFSLEDLKELSSTTGFGGRLKVTGDVIGPYEYTGVSIKTLANEFDSIPSSYDMISISDDGYVMKFTHDQILGNVEVYDENGSYVDEGGVEMILAYAEEGEPLIHGGPLRIAFVNNGLVTDAFYWSKYIEELEFVFDNSDNDPPDISIDKPQNAIYYFDTKFFNYPKPVIIGDITFEISAFDDNEITKVLFIMDEIIRSKQQYPPFEWNWDEKAIGTYTIQIICYDNAGNIGMAQKEFAIINFF